MEPPPPTKNPSINPNNARFFRANPEKKYHTFVVFHSPQSGNFMIPVEKYQKFRWYQKMPQILSLKKTAFFSGVGFPVSISRIHTAYIGEDSSILGT